VSTKSPVTFANWDKTMNLALTPNPSPARLSNLYLPRLFAGKQLMVCSEELGGLPPKPPPEGVIGEN
jgi:hypothetical protein